jgi:hypothetical protein
MFGQQKVFLKRLFACLALFFPLKKAIASLILVIALKTSKREKESFIYNRDRHGNHQPRLHHIT